MSSWDTSLWWMVGKISSKATTVVFTARWCYCSCPYGLYQQKSNWAILRPSRGNSSTEWLNELSCSDLQHGWEQNAAQSSSSKRHCPKRTKEGSLPSIRKERTNHCPGMCECNRAVNTTHGDFRGQILKLSVDRRRSSGDILWNER